MANSKKKYAKKRSINRNKYNRTIKRKQRGGASKQESYNQNYLPNLRRTINNKLKALGVDQSPTLLRTPPILTELTTIRDNREIDNAHNQFVTFYNQSIEDYKTSVENIKTTITGVKGEEYSSWCEIYRDATQTNSVYDYFVRVLNYMKLYGPVDLEPKSIPTSIDRLSKKYPKKNVETVLDTYYNNLFNAMGVETTIYDDDELTDDDVLKYLIILSGLFKIYLKYKEYEIDFEKDRGSFANEYVGKLFGKLSYSGLVESLIKKLYLSLTKPDKQPNILRRVLFVLCISFKVLKTYQPESGYLDRLKVFTVTTTNHLYEDSANIPQILLGKELTEDEIDGLTVNFDMGGENMARLDGEQYLAIYYESLVFPTGTQTHLDVLNKSLEGLL
jgi:hypothetical protein